MSYTGLFLISEMLFGFHFLGFAVSQKVHKRICTVSVVQYNNVIYTEVYLILQ